MCRFDVLNWGGVAGLLPKRSAPNDAGELLRTGWEGVWSWGGGEQAGQGHADQEGSFLALSME